ncbi:MAG: protein phosphatase 2C domain-containing protein [Leptospirales bacterium]|nr:protein phosphatase 2C domain-containing protein [Leptospirales bacterium]
MREFQVWCAKEVGNTHHLARQNCQDAVACLDAPDCIVGVVCDGSSSHKHSEVGSRLASRIVCTVLTRYETAKDISRFITESIQMQLGNLAASFPDLFAFNITAFQAKAHATNVWRLGDGVVMINGVEMKRSPSRYFDFSERNNNPFEEWSISTAELESLLIGSDGVAELDLRYSQTQADGQSMGRMADILTLDQDAITRKLQSAQLSLISDGVRRSGIIQDDISLVVVRRVSIPGAD